MTTPNDPEFGEFLIDRAIAECRIHPDSRAEWLERFGRDPEGTRGTLAALASFSELLASADTPTLAKADRWGQPPGDDRVYRDLYPGGDS
jgi:hypothetical protein